MKWYNTTMFKNVRKTPFIIDSLNIFAIIGDIKCVTNLNILLGIIEISEFLFLNLLMMLLISKFEVGDKKIDV